MKITGETALFYIVGTPVAHYRAPILFNDYFHSKERNFCAAALNVLPEHLAHTLDTVRHCDNIRGLCITMPHKIAAAALMDQLTESAATIGSVNFVRREADGTLTGHNIDGQGFLRGLAANNIATKGAHVVLVGVGGVGRAIAFSLARAGVATLTLINRDVEKARALAKELAPLAQVSVLEPGQPADLAHTTLLINATSVGAGDNTTLPLPLDGLTSACAVADVVLNPIETELIKAARALGCTVSPGSAMLRPQIELCEEFLYP